MRSNKHLLLWSSLGVLVLLVVAAVQEHFGKEWRQLQRSAVREPGEAPESIRLRQVIVPALALTDRCISCHVGMAPGERMSSADPTLGPHPAVGHDPAEYGCTICHAGQGRATEKDHAHGAVAHWPSPMIPLRFAEAGCGSCHVPTAVPTHATLARSLHLIERLDCLACHEMDGRGGSIRPGDVEPAPGPDLSRVGARGYRPDWYSHHLAEHQRARDGAWAFSMAPITPEQLDVLEIALRTRVGAPRLVEARALVHSLGCLGCHAVEGVGGDDGPDLTSVGDKDPGQMDFSHVRGPRTPSAWHREHFRRPAAVVTGSLMPDMDLSEDQIELLILYVLSLRRTELPPAYWPDDRLRIERFGASQFTRDPATTYAALCSGCHGPRGEGRRYAGLPPFPSVASADFLRVASDRFIGETIRRGRPGRRMPAWGGEGGVLDDEEIDRLVEYLRDLGGVSAPLLAHEELWSRAEPSRGAALYAETCARCHGPDGEGLEGPALSNRVFLETASDGYIAATIRWGRSGTTMEGFATPSVTRRTLSTEEIASIVAHIRSWEVSR